METVWLFCTGLVSYNVYMSLQIKEGSLAQSCCKCAKQEAWNIEPLLLRCNLRVLWGWRRAVLSALCSNYQFWGFCTTGLHPSLDFSCILSSGLSLIHSDYWQLMGEGKSKVRPVCPLATRVWSQFGLTWGELFASRYNFCSTMSPSELELAVEPILTLSRRRACNPWSCTEDSCGSETPTTPLSIVSLSGLLRWPRCLQGPVLWWQFHPPHTSCDSRMSLTSHHGIQPPLKNNGEQLSGLTAGLLSLPGWQIELDDFSGKC